MNMTAKEYLRPSYHIDYRINNKLDQAIRTSKETIQMCTHRLQPQRFPVARAALLAQALRLRESLSRVSAFSDMPRSASPNPHSMEAVIVKIIDIEREINEDIDRLVDLKAVLMDVIHNMPNVEYQALSELRYLDYKT
jgi:hypothetical protein